MVTLLKNFKPNGDDLKALRREAGFSREKLAFLIYGDESKFQRIGKIERGEVDVGFSEGMKWFQICCIKDDEKSRTIDDISSSLANLLNKTK